MWRSFSKSAAWLASREFYYKYKKNYYKCSDFKPFMDLVCLFLYLECRTLEKYIER